MVSCPIQNHLRRPSENAPSHLPRGSCPVWPGKCHHPEVGSSGRNQTGRLQKNLGGSEKPRTKWRIYWKKKINGGDISIFFRAHFLQFLKLSMMYPIVRIPIRYPLTVQWQRPCQTGAGTWKRSLKMGHVQGQSVNWPKGSTILTAVTTRYLQYLNLWGIALLI